MNEMKEIEIKFDISSNANEIGKRVEGMYELLTSKIETDIYYTSKHKDFISSEECLRIRKSDDTTEITWKPPTSQKMKEDKQFWKEEINVPLVDDICQLRKLLNRLDFVEYCIVNKKRRYFRVDDETTLTIDIVDNAGVFLEVETMSVDVSAGVAKNSSTAKLLQLDEDKIVNTPYRDLVV